MKEGSEKTVLKLSIQKTKIMALSPITSWQIDAETVERMADFIFLGYKITAYGDCSHEIKSRLLLGRKVMTNLDSILKSRDMEKEIATHSSILAWENPWTEEPGWLQSLGLHDWACVHEGGGWRVGSNKLVELKKNKK